MSTTQKKSSVHIISENHEDGLEILVEINKDKPHNNFFERGYEQTDDHCKSYRSYGWGIDWDNCKKGHIKDIMDKNEKEIYESLPEKPKMITFRYYFQE